MSNLKVPIPQKGRTDAETLQNVLDSYARLARAFSAFQNAIGSENIPLLITNETQIRSEDGATEIVGPLLVMKDKQDVPIVRLLMGYDAATEQFTFKIFNADGTQTVGVDDSGNGTFTGTVTGSTITGGTINVESTVVINPEGEGGIDFGNATIYRDSNGYLTIHTASGIAVSGDDTVSLVSPTLIFNANRIGFFDQVYNPEVQQTAQKLPEDGSSTMHNIEVKINGILDKLKAYGLFSVSDYTP